MNIWDRNEDKHRGQEGETEDQGGHRHREGEVCLAGHKSNE